MARVEGKDEGSRVAVVIPYYQRTPGLLVRALTSIFDQGYAPTPTVVVVDDSSPLPAKDEVLALPPDLQSHVKVIVQDNAGPGAARNVGLDSLGEDVDYVAFLDSDDQWLEGHLVRAVAGLDSGRDLFFSNFLDINQGEGGFQTRGTIDTAHHTPVPGVPEVFAYESDLRDAVLTGCPVETSTVVYRRSVFGGLRFRREFRHAYEDYVFWFAMAAGSTRVVFSSAVGVQYGVGVNLYRGAGADMDAQFRVAVGSTMFGASVRAEYDLTPDQESSVADRLKRNRRTIAYHLLHRLRRGQAIPLQDLQRFLRADPRSWVLLPGEMFRQVLGQRKPAE